MVQKLVCKSLLLYIFGVTSIVNWEIYTMSEEFNSILGKIVLSIILIVAVAGCISIIANDQADGFGTVVLVIVIILAIFGLGRTIIER